MYFCVALVFCSVFYFILFQLVTKQTQTKSTHIIGKLLKVGASPKARDTLHDFWLSETKDWYHETTVAISDSPRLFHDDNLSPGTAKNRAVCLGL